MEKKTQVLVAGLPGKMATLIVQRLAQDPRYEIVPYSFTGPEITDDTFEIILNARGIEKMRFKLIHPLQTLNYISEIMHNWPNVIIIDFTQPDAANPNCEFYCACGLPHIMGTTGGDDDLLVETVLKSKTAAVIYPNMSIPINLFMYMIKNAAETFPGVLDGFRLVIDESHQATKKDKSGTADKIGKNLLTLGADYKGIESINAIRDRDRQLLMGVPKEKLGGHAYHTYSLISPDDSVRLGFLHNVDGRDTYVDGTIKAIDFLSKKLAEGAEGQFFSMIDVMKG